MLIINHETQNAHPITAQISETLWFELFQVPINWDETQIANKQLSELVRTDLPNNNKQAFTLALIVFSEAPIKELLHFAQNNLKLSPQNIFDLCVAMRRTDLLDEFKKQRPYERFWKYKKYQSHAFVAAAENGFIDVLNWLKALDTSVEHGFEGLIQADEYYVFRCAAFNGHFDTLLWIAEHAPDDLEQMIEAYNYAAFRTAANSRHLHILKWMAEQCPGLLQAMIKAGDYGAFRDAADNNYLEIMQWLVEQIASCEQALEEESQDDGFSCGLQDSDDDKAPFSVLAMIQADNYFAFHKAAEHGDLVTLKWLEEQAPEHLELMIQSEHYHAFRLAAKNGHNHVLDQLAEKAPEQLLFMIQAEDKQLPLKKYHAFRGAAAQNHIDTLEWLKMHVSGIEFKLQEMIQEGDYFAVCMAAANGHLDVLKWLALNSPHQLQAMTQADKYYAFRWAAANGHLDVLEWLALNAPQQLQDMIKADRYDAFCMAAENGHLDVLHWIAQKASDQLQAMIEEKDYAGANMAAAQGHLDVLKWFKTLGNQDNDSFERLIRNDDYQVFQKAAEGGHLHILKWLAEELPEEVGHMIMANDHFAFCIAAEKGYIDMIAWFKEIPTINLSLLIKEDQNYALIAAANNGQLETFLRLVDEIPDELEAIIQANRYSLFRDVARNNYDDICDCLLNSPQCLAYAEEHVQEYNDLVAPFIFKTLNRLHYEQESTPQEHTPFDIHEPQRVKHCFYLIRNLVRKNNSRLDDELRFLLNIPSVKAMAPSNNNELLRLALNSGNRGAAEILINIRSVRELAEQNNFYQDEARSGIDLGQLAADTESSMTALSRGEQKRLDEAIKHYQPRLKEIGVPYILDSLRAQLIVRYQAHPASLIVNGQKLELPYDIDTFDALKLSEEQYNEALKAYYQHKDHSAWRYLLKPNPWMHPFADYVYFNEDETQAWSTFEDYQPLIAMFWLAAIDEQAIAPTSDINLEGRIEHFIDELALINRAHNWDQSRIRPDGTEEEYDDLEGDRPSCYSGVKRRLFQSVLEHPLLKVLILDDILQEIRVFARDYFISQITLENKKPLKEAFDKYFSTLDEQDALPLKCLNIPEYEQQKLKDHLIAQYGEQYTGEKIFTTLVNHTLLLNPEAFIVSDRFHALKLDGLTQIYNHLKTLCAKSVSGQSIFSKSANSNNPDEDKQSSHATKPK